MLNRVLIFDSLTFGMSEDKIGKIMTNNFLKTQCVRHDRPKIIIFGTSRILGG
ncbi:hypothetical protein ISS37_00810 [candidate division KSB1 bacterium]|nr:hypothetical protein [candidate division KSB1 bacterium]